MLEPKGTDLPALFLVLVVLPLVAYILLGKWSEVAKKNERISLLAELAAEEAFKSETLAAASVIPVIPIIPSAPIVVVPKSLVHVCARCSVPATTRCSRCKSVRYCSGKCQIIHWRQVHKHECQQLETNSCNSSPMASLNGDSFYEKPLLNDDMNLHFSGYNEKQSEHKSNANGLSANTGCTLSESSEVTMTERRSSERRVSRKLKARREEEDAHTSHEMKNIDPEPVEEDISRKHNGYNGASNGHITRSAKHENCDFQDQYEKNNDPIREDLHRDNRSKDDVAELMPLTKRADRANSASHSNGTKVQKSQKSVTKASREQTRTGIESSEIKSDDTKFSHSKDTVPTQGKNSVDSSMGIMKMIGLKKSTKLGKNEASQVASERDKNSKMLFPYGEFAKLFQYEMFNLSPRGLLNCGNSCYCNAVLQCLTFTKPLTIYLLGRSHSKTCCAKKWCLMCELEQHVIMLREGGGPLSPGRILKHMRSINRQIGDGSQEDAHEFLRLLLTSMQSICLESWGGENVVDPRLQETTFIQHTFGGRLKSKVNCMRCHHESERYENMMDLTLEIHGWVESLEDALTQFTTPEDLDGENMYRCGRCVSYVRARKQLSIHEAPNILTIVLKRFQEGSYGKINKYITFPELLDMVPFMTGTNDVPPLYMLYGVVVHLDTHNASFSGHYVSYVKDLSGNWLRIDDTEVQPVSMSQVMSEGAYILFYMRSSPRPLRAHSNKQTWHHFISKNQKPSKPIQTKSSCHLVGPDPSSDPRHTNCIPPPRDARYTESFSDPASSDWSIFTSSDEASFTTESRDSFSTVDTDPFSSIFETIYGPGPGLGPDYSRTVSCRSFSSSKPLTRFFHQEQGFVSDAHLSSQEYERVSREDSRRAPYYCKT